MRTLSLLAPLTLKAAANGKPRRFSILAYSGGLLNVSGFPLPVIVDLAGLEAGAVVIVLDHEVTTETTLGQVDKVTNDGRSLNLTGTITGSSPRVRDVLAAADAGQQWQASIGANVQATEQIPEGRTVAVNGQTFVGPVIVARRATLKETSVLPVGADSSTTENLAAKAAGLLKGNDMPTFEEWLIEQKIELEGLSPAVVGILQQAYEAASKTSTPASPTAQAAALLDLRAAAAADHDRIAKINAVSIGYPAIAATAIRLGWNAIETENHVLKASRLMNTPSNRAYGNNDVAATSQHISAALMVKAGYSSAAEKEFGERIMEQSKSLHGASLVDMCRASLAADGKECPAERSQMLRASLSTGSMPVALGDSANKILTEAYSKAPSAWKSFAAVKPAANFKTQTSIRPTFAGDLSQLAPGGEIKHGSYTEETYDWSVDTFAKQFQIDRRDIVNDDASVFSDVVPGLARAAARSLNSLVITKLLANAGTFFGTGNSNYFDGAATNLQASSLATAIKMLRQMTDAEGNLLDLAPSVLLVPPELEQTALALINSSEVARVSTGDQLPTGNTFKNIATLAVEPRLSTATFSGYSTVAWYLFSDPRNAAVIVGFLDGMQSPTLETFGLDHDINTLSFGFRVYHDYGCALADYRAAIRSKGAA